uniref:General transcription factor IIH subunit n=1 Tax=Triatoma infestans TaxID=30076 RepID=A0A023F313_TRIIF
MGEDGEDFKEYRWETGYEKTWEAIQEDEKGNVEASVHEIIQRAKRKAQMERKGHTRLGMMRHMYVILDGSEAMLDQDLKPIRQGCTLKLMEEFIEEFLYESPLSQLGFILTRNKRAEKISDLTGNSKKHLEVLKANYTQSSCSGEPSLQNGLELALSSLKHMPTHAIREVLIIMGSLTTCDPGDINITIQALKNCGIRVSVIGIGAEVRLCRHLCHSTGGVYSVVLDDLHFKHLLHEHVFPPAAVPSNSTDNALIKMGFPHHGPTDEKTTALAMCMCHLESETCGKLEGGGYLCPQCRSKYCELPVECKVCGLTLVSAPHLARSYHHLFPVGPFTPIPVDTSHCCFACRIDFKEIDKQIFKCETCTQVFCLDCDMFIHDTLHTCPGCATNQKTFQNVMDV